MKKTLFVSMTFLGALLLTLGVAEIGLHVIPSSHRLAYSRQDYLSNRNYLHKEFGESDSDRRINFHLIPGKTGSFSDKEFSTTIEINSKGFRGPEWTFNQNHKRLVVLGDSIPFGWGVENEQNFPSLISQKAKNWDVVNLSVPGYNMMNEYATLERWGPQVKPHHVLLVFYQNDIIGMGDPGFSRMHWPSPATGLDRFYLFRFLSQLGRPKSIYYQRIDSRAWSKCETYLDAISDWCTRNKTNFSIVYVPCRDELRESKPVGARHLISEYAARQDIPFKDITPLIQAATLSQDVYFELDDHLTAHGHQVVANALADFIP